MIRKGNEPDRERDRDKKQGANRAPHPQPRKHVLMGRTVLAMLVPVAAMAPKPLIIDKGGKAGDWSRQAMAGGLGVPVESPGERELCDGRNVE